MSLYLCVTLYLCHFISVSLYLCVTLSLSLVLCHLSSVTCPQSLVLRHLSSVTCPPSLVLRNFISVTCPPSLYLCHLSFLSTAVFYLGTSPLLCICVCLLLVPTVCGVCVCIWVLWDASLSFIVYTCTFVVCKVICDEWMRWHIQYFIVDRLEFCRLLFVDCFYCN